jgi:diguanylate cyclase (GGDEF)-like protein
MRPAAGGVLMIDVDHFKRVNDRFGHQAGDQVLVAVAADLARVLRPTDRLGRYGGEEFLVVTEDRTPQALQQFAESVRAAIAQTDLGGVAPDLAVTVSVGGAMLAAIDDPQRDLAASLHLADVALYRAKVAGRDRALLEMPGRRQGAESVAERV